MSTKTVNLSNLQKKFEDAKKQHKSNTTKLRNAERGYDESKKALAGADEALTSAVRSVREG